jgi:hypothetical protein
LEINTSFNFKKTQNEVTNFIDSYIPLEVTGSSFGGIAFNNDDMNKIKEQEG